MKPNVDPAALAQFERLAARWWDPEGESRALHDLNPAQTGLRHGACRIAW
jgi:2-polyprenyl-6-hydroxyphenyl methylase/3-demethylubiquinone-9 3-methyltransferase